MAYCVKENCPILGMVGHQDVSAANVSAEMIGQQWMADRADHSADCPSGYIPGRSHEIRN
jgi:hypothetical protein